MEQAEVVRIDKLGLTGSRAMASLAASLSVPYGTMTIWTIDQFNVVIILTVGSVEDQLSGFTVEDHDRVIMSPIQDKSHQIPCLFL
jgi:hypothetical protein